MLSGPAVLAINELVLYACRAGSVARHLANTLLFSLWVVGAALVPINHSAHEEVT